MTVPELLFEATLKGSVLITLAGLFLALCRNLSASTRHLIWFMCLIGVLVLPLLLIVTPDWRIAPERTLSWASEQTVQGNRPVSGSGQLMMDGAADRGASPILAVSGAKGNTPLSVSSILVAVWIGGLLVVLLRLAIGLARARRNAQKSMKPPDPSVEESMDILRKRSLIRRPLLLVFSETSGTPFVWGWRRPMIVLPCSAKTWSTRRLSMVLSHELAHVQRYDNITCLVGWLAVAAHWFNPLVWLAVRRMRAEQERACDDCVLGQGVSAPEYAEQLLDISRSSSTHQQPGLEAAFMNKSQLGERLMAILKLDRRRAPLSLARAALLALLTAAVVLPLAALADRQAIQLDSVTPTQRDGIVTTLSEFYDALNAGDDYRITCQTYLSSGYFDPPGLTMENLEDGIWEAAFQNTLDMFTKKGVTGSLVARDWIKAIRHVGDSFIATLELNLTGEAYQVESVWERDDRIGIKPVRDPVTGDPIVAEAYLAKALEHEVIFRIENGEWKIARYDGPLGIKRMDVDNPYGPIFLVWLEDIGQEMTPYGQMISKVIPEQFRPFNNVGIEFRLEN